MLYVLFSKYGQVISLKISKDYETKRSKGFGFVSYGDPIEGIFS